MDSEIVFVGKQYLKKCIKCGKNSSREKRSEALRSNWNFCSRSCRTSYYNILNNPMSDKTIRDKATVSYRKTWKEKYQEMKEKIHTKEAIYKRRHCLFKKGLEHWNWQGGKTEEGRQIRNSKEYKQWRNDVFRRDNYICQMCFQKRREIEADHIKPFSIYPDLRLSVNNGRTLCRKCHKNTNTYGYNFIRLMNTNKIRPLSL